ncbi:MAG: HD domain-containing protein [Bradymonadia bacterium]
MVVEPTFIRALAYAARMHRDQRRKGSRAEPYIDHCIEVARLLVEVGGLQDVALLSAALLHDVVEDTVATEADVRAEFGDEIADLVMEVTDDKRLPKMERKRLQVEHAAHASHRARCLKLADKISNVSDLLADPPKNWEPKRVVAYGEWALAVAKAVEGTHPDLEAMLIHRIDSLRTSYA